MNICVFTDPQELEELEWRKSWSRRPFNWSKSCDLFLIRRIFSCNIWIIKTNLKDYKVKDMAVNNKLGSHNSKSCWSPERGWASTCKEWRTCFLNCRPFRWAERRKESKPGESSCHSCPNRLAKDSKVLLVLFRGKPMVPGQDSKVLRALLQSQSHSSEQNQTKGGQ